MSKSTVVSIVPFPILETKPGIYPGIFRIPASKNGIPEILVIGDSIYHVEVDENRTITVTSQSESIARSIVNDYVSSNLAFSLEDNAFPGIFWIPGVSDLNSILVTYSERLEQARVSQNNWFTKLVQSADDDWEKTRQHKAISNMSRYAARALNLDRPWLINIPQAPLVVESVKCVACDSSVSPVAIVCPNCKCILNMEKYKTLQFADIK